EEPSDWSEWSRPEHPAGKPKAPAGTPSAERVSDPRGGGLEVTWPKMTEDEANGEPITDYVVTASSRESKTVDASKPSATSLHIARHTTHTVRRNGVNSVGRGDGSAARAKAVARGAAAAAPSGGSASMRSGGEDNGPDGRATVRCDAAARTGPSVTQDV